MEKLIQLKKDKTLLVASKIVNFDLPDTLYIPLINLAKILVKKGDIVKIGTPLYKTRKEVITSPISGKVSDIKKIITLNGPEDALVLINDYAEKKVIDPIAKINLNNLNAEKLNALLEFQFKLNFLNKENLVLNAIDDETYVFTENFYLLNYYEEFLDFMDKLKDIFKFKKLYITLKATSSENINKLLECLGMYPEIELKIVPDLYPLGEEHILSNYLKLDSPKSVFIKSSLMYDIYNLIKRNRQKTTRLLTINGNAIKNPLIMSVKIGTKLEDLINNYISFTNDMRLFIINGLMSGKVVNIKDFIITEDIGSVLIMKDLKTPKEEACINCSMCEKICPVGLNPLLFKDKNYLTKAQEKCLNCGLCSYICPVFINFNKYIRGEEDEKNTFNS